MAEPAVDFLAARAPQAGVPAASALPATAVRSPASVPRAPVPLRELVQQAERAFPAAAVPAPAAGAAIAPIDTRDPTALSLAELTAIMRSPAYSPQEKDMAYGEVVRRQTEAAMTQGTGPVTPIEAEPAPSTEPAPTIPALDPEGRPLKPRATGRTGVPYMPVATPEFIDAVIAAESGGNPRAVSPTGAAGLMQIMPATAADPGYGVRRMRWEDRFDPEENRRFGVEYLNAMLREFNGDPEAALVAYNAGPGYARKWLRSGADPATLPKETRKYVAKILPVLRQELWTGEDEAPTVSAAAGDGLVDMRPGNPRLMAEDGPIPDPAMPTASARVAKRPPATLDELVAQAQRFIIPPGWGGAGSDDMGPRVPIADDGPYARRLQTQGAPAAAEPAFSFAPLHASASRQVEPSGDARPAAPQGPLVPEAGTRPIAPEAGLITPAPVAPLRTHTVARREVGPTTERSLPQPVRQEVSQAAQAAAAATSASPEEAKEKSRLWEALLLFGLSTLAASGASNSNLGAIAQGGLSALQLLNAREKERREREEKESAPPTLETLYDDQGNPYTAQWDKKTRSWVKVAGGKREKVTPYSDVGKLRADRDRGVIGQAEYEAELRRLYQDKDRDGPKTNIGKAREDLAKRYITPAEYNIIVAKESRLDPLTQAQIDEKEWRRQQAEQQRQDRIDQDLRDWLVNARSFDNPAYISITDPVEREAKIMADARSLFPDATLFKKQRPAGSATGGTTGSATGPLPDGVTADQAYAQAKAAVAAGKDPAAVRARLVSWGLDPSKAGL